MDIRWRLGVMVVQLLIVTGVAVVVLGRPYSADLWFVAGLVPVAIYPLLLEPYYARPPDIAANAFVYLILYLTTPESFIGTGRDIFAGVALVAFLLAVFALAAGARRKEMTRLVRLAHSARSVSSLVTARVLYSAVFLLSLLADRETLGDTNSWWLVSAWLALVVVGQINWQSVWSTLNGAPAPCDAEAMVGPSRLLVATSQLPEPGSWVSLKAGSTEASGVVITRIRRSGDVWGQILVSERAACEKLLVSTGLTIRTVDQPSADVVGAVDLGSTDAALRFVATRPLETGRVVAIKQNSTEILYQLAAAEIEQSTVKGGSHLVVRVHAPQLGHFDESTRRLKRHRWVPSPGVAILGKVTEPSIDPGAVPDTWIRLGHVIGTAVPIFLDLDTACEAHLVILGMTKMGKTSLAARLAKVLGADRPVVIFDQTGEYVSVRGLPEYDPDNDLDGASVSVLEPEQNKNPAVLANGFLTKLATKAQAEYAAGALVPRTLVMDEAHQFIPETFGMKFGVPERDAAENFGRLMMQVRKYGISIILVSQRTAVVSKSALSQCENFIAFRYVDKTGLEYLETVAGADARKLVPKLEQGQALVFGPAVTSDSPVAIQVELEAADPAEE